jgi:hypothetical protein
MTRWLLTLTLVGALGGSFFLTASLVSAQPASVEAEEGSKAHWQERYLALKAQASRATEDLTHAKRDYNKAKQRGNLRGDYKHDIMARIQSAETQLEDAQAALVALPDEARAAGIPPGWFREVDADYSG